MTWDGTDFLTLWEWMELIHLYGVDPHPSVTAQHAISMKTTPEGCLQRLRNSSPIFIARWEKKNGRKWVPPKADPKEDEWDKYVADFVSKHKLDEPRTKRAYQLLDRCKKIRRYYSNKHGSAMQKAEGEGDKAKLERYGQIPKRIFDRALVPGLKRLLPRTRKG